MSTGAETTSLAKTDEIIAAQRRAGTQVAVISQHRCDTATEVSVTAIGNGELGRLTSGGQPAMINPISGGASLSTRSRIDNDLIKRSGLRASAPRLLCSGTPPVWGKERTSKGDIR